MNISLPTTSQGLYDISYGIVFSYTCVLVILCVKHCFTVFPMPVFIFIQYTDSHDKSLILPLPKWLLCNCCRICFCIRKGIIILLPSMAMPSTIANSTLIGQKCLKTCSYTSFFLGQLCIMYDLSFCI